MTNYYFDDTNKILIREFTAEVDVDLIIETWEYILDNYLDHPNLKGVVTDFRHSKPNLDMQTFEIMMKYFKSKIEIFQEIHMAQVMTTPEISLPMLFQMQNMGIVTKPFSTLEAALDWIRRA